MRIRTVTGLAFAAAAVAAAAGLGTAAHSDETGETLVIFTEESGNRAGTAGPAADGAAAQWDCPERGAGSPATQRPSHSTADSL